MTIAELQRYFDSAKRKMESQERKQASFDYVLADLIGRSIARVYNSSNKMPTLAEAYPQLFDKEEEAEKIQEQKDKLSALRFELFAQSFNQRFKEGSQKLNE